MRPTPGRSARASRGKPRLLLEAGCRDQGIEHLALADQDDGREITVAGKGEFNRLHNLGGALPLVHDLPELVPQLLGRERPRRT